uniref:Transposase n=1 Tax=Haemonchus contortus TaxID=6289 RepID=A0A7I5EE92_HAECO
MAVNALRRRNRQQELLDFSLKDVYGKMQMDHLDLQEWLRSMGLLALPLCPICQGPMSPRNDEHHNGWLRSMGPLALPLCPICQGPMSPRNDEHHNGWVCHRRSCRTGPSNELKVYVPARKGFFFEKSNLAE